MSGKKDEKELIIFPEKEPLRIIRKSFVDICEGDCRRAAILDLFYYWTRHKPGRPEERWIWKTEEEIAAGIFDVAKSPTTIRAAVRWLEEHRLLSIRRNPIHKWDRTKQYRFEEGAVQAAIDALPSRSDSADEGVEDSESNRHSGPDEAPDMSVPSAMNSGAIPKITPEITSESSSGRRRESAPQDLATKGRGAVRPVATGKAVPGERTRGVEGPDPASGMPDDVTSPPATDSLSSRIEALRKAHEALSGLRTADLTPPHEEEDIEAARWLAERGHTPEDHESLYRSIHRWWSDAAKRKGNGKPASIYLHHCKSYYAGWNAGRRSPPPEFASHEDRFAHHLAKCRHPHRYDPTYWDAAFAPDPSPFSAEDLEYMCIMGEEPGKAGAIYQNPGVGVLYGDRIERIPASWAPSSRYPAPPNADVMDDHVPRALAAD